eukprot:COSAG01_NODE_31902_length_589_cov_2.583673_2_plen_25_part_01
MGVGREPELEADTTGGLCEQITLTL